MRRARGAPGQPRGPRPPGGGRLVAGAGGGRDDGDQGRALRVLAGHRAEDVASAGLVQCAWSLQCPGAAE